MRFLSTTATTMQLHIFSLILPDTPNSRGNPYLLWYQNVKISAVKTSFSKFTLSFVIDTSDRKVLYPHSSTPEGNQNLQV